VDTRYLIRDPVDVQDWTVANSGEGEDGAPVWFSPDRSFFFFETQHGDLGCDCNIYELNVFSVVAVRAALNAGRTPQALRIIPIHSTAGYGFYTGGITNTAWESTETLRFIAQFSPDSSAIYRFNAQSNELSQITADDRQIFGVNVSYASNSILYTTGQEAQRRDVIRYPAQPVRGDFLRYLGGDQPSTTEVYAGFRGQQPRRIASYSSPHSGHRPANPALSPDGRWAVFVAPAFSEHADSETVTIPGGWQRYDGLASSPHLGDPASYERFGQRGPDAYSRLWRTLLVDVSSGQTRVLSDAPWGPSSTAPTRGGASILWSADSRHVILVNANLPLDCDAQARRSMAYLIEFDIASGRRTILEPMVSRDTGRGRLRIANVAWQGYSLLVRHVDAQNVEAPPTRYEFTNSGWRRTAVKVSDIPIAPSAPQPPSMDTPVKIALRENANEPAMLIVSDDHHEAALMAPDPALAGVRRAKVQPVEWRSATGKVENGALMLPVGLQGSPPPLVVQISDWRGDDAMVMERFLPDGAAPALFAAQPFAARGMAVLQISGRTESERELFRAISASQPGQLWRQDAQVVANRVDSAVVALAQRNLIDPRRVGVIGFSRTGYYTHFLVTHPGQIVPQAAIVADSVTESFGESNADLARARSSTTRYAKEVAALYGGPFWQNRQTWLEAAPSFNVDSVETPTLFTYHGSGDWTFTLIAETLGAFRANHREADMLIFPEAGHQIQRPRQRLAALNASVDWMRFWLRGEEDPAPDKIQQYVYWRSLRDQRDARWQSDRRAGRSVDLELRNGAIVSSRTKSNQSRP
jgi:dipeptidyl aminopeptidase/acylaminoacyl peptidase